MKYLLECALLIVFMLVPDASAAQQYGSSGGGPVYDAGLRLGYYGGPGVQVIGTVSELAEGFPLGIRIGAGYTFLDPGSAPDARRIFINNATNGVPETQGHSWDLRMDFLYATKMWRTVDSYLFTGPRYARFLGNFRYVGGNEDFDVVSHPWGWGVGLENRFPVAQDLNFVLSGGLDYYPSTTLTGHDTSYRPDNDNVNQREDFTYSDADEAISQPKLEFRIMLGFDLRP
jgi:hypothetical protein